MKLFQKLASFLRGGERVKDKIDMSFERLCDLPLYAFLSGEPPFDQWCHPKISIPEEHQNLVRGCVGLYQFFIFFSLIQERYGNEAAASILPYWAMRLSKEKGDNKGFEVYDTIQSAVRFILKAVQAYAEKPCVVETPDEGSMVAPVEYALAVQFLVDPPTSPFHITREELRDESTRESLDFGGLDFKLADCLADGKRRAEEVFGHMIEVANVTRW